MQDNIQPIPHSLALAIVSQEVPCLLETLSPSPVAAASLCSVRIDDEFKTRPIVIRLGQHTKFASYGCVIIS